MMPDFRFTRRAWMMRVGALVGGGAAGLPSALAGEFKAAPFPNWNDDTVLKLLVDSPWAHARTVKLSWYGLRGDAEAISYKDVPGTRPGLPTSATVQGGSPVGGIGGGATKMRNKLPDQADLIFRWSSALPVRQAKALYRAREQKRDLARVGEMVEAMPLPGHVLEIYGIPLVAAHAGVEAVSAKLRQSTVLRSKNNRVRMVPDRVDTAVMGEWLSISIHFPAPASPFRAEDRELTCTGSAGELFAFEERFRLSDMKYQGSLEL